MKRLLLAVALLAVLAGAYYYYTTLHNSPQAMVLRNSPQDAVLKASKAIESHDMTSFERFVDVDAVTGSLVNDVAQQSSALTSLVPAGGLLLRGGLGLLKPQLSKAARKEVQRLVETGSLQEARAAAPKHLVNVSILGLASRLIGPESKFKGVKYTNERVDDATMGLEFTQPRYDTTVVVDVELRQQADGHWQVKRVTNTPTLLQQVVRQEGKRLIK